MRDQGFISRHQAQVKHGITAPRLKRAIESGEIAASHIGTRTVLVREADVLRVLSAPAPQQAA